MVKIKFEESKEARDWLVVNKLPPAFNKGTRSLPFLPLLKYGETFLYPARYLAYLAGYKRPEAMVSSVVRKSKNESFNFKSGSEFWTLKNPPEELLFDQGTKVKVIRYLTYGGLKIVLNNSLYMTPYKNLVEAWLRESNEVTQLSLLSPPKIKQEMLRIHAVKAPSEKDLLSTVQGERKAAASKKRSSIKVVDSKSPENLFFELMTSLGQGSGEGNSLVLQEISSLRDEIRLLREEVSSLRADSNRPNFTIKNMKKLLVDLSDNLEAG